MKSVMEGFVRIHPDMEFETACPFTGGSLRAIDWAVPGSWTLAKVRSAETGHTYWTDLPFGHGLLAPCFLDVASGEVVRPGGERWYADATRAAWRARTTKPTTVRVERGRKARRVCLVNCLNPYWGDAVSLLLRINQLRVHTDLDIVVLATANLAWLIPDFVAEAWLVDDSLPSTAEWNDQLAEQVKTLVLALDVCYIPVTFQPAQLSSQELFEFSRVHPFVHSAWNERLRERPVVTFAWRDDRCWSEDGDPPASPASPLARSRYLRGASRYYRRAVAARALREQTRRVAALAERLRTHIPTLDFGVMGVGRGTPLPTWITDLRRGAIDETTEREWCGRAAESHVVVGVHGSHMLLPSGHAGATIELLPRQRIVNILQDLLVPVDGPREAMYRCRVLPLDTPAVVVADTILSVLYNYSWMRFACDRRYAGLVPMTDVDAMRASQAVRADVLRTVTAGSPAGLVGP